VPGEGCRYPFQIGDELPPKPTTDQIASFNANAPPNIPRVFVEFHRQHGAVSVDLNAEDCGFVFLWPLADVFRMSREYGFDEFCPGIIGVGSDGGGGIFAFDLRTPERAPIGLISATYLEYTDFLPIDDSFE